MKAADLIVGKEDLGEGRPPAIDKVTDKVAKELVTQYWKMLVVSPVQLMVLGVPPLVRGARKSLGVKRAIKYVARSRDRFAASLVFAAQVADGGRVMRKA